MIIKKMIQSKTSKNGYKKIQNSQVNKLLQKINYFLLPDSHITQNKFFLKYILKEIIPQSMMSSK